MHANSVVRPSERPLERGLACRARSRQHPRIRHSFGNSLETTSRRLSTPTWGAMLLACSSDG